MKSVTELIVGKNVAYLAGTDGALALIKEDGSALVAGETIADAPKFYIEQTLATTANKFRTALIEGSGMLRYKGQSYAAPALQSVTINFDGTLSAAGTVLKLWIIFKSEKQIFQIRKSYEYTVLASDTLTTVAGQFRTKIAADTTLTGYIAESGATTTVILTTVAPVDVTGNSTELDVSAAYFDLARNADLEATAPVANETAVTNPDPGFGTYNQVRLLEWETKGYRGHTNRVMFTDNPTFYSVVGATYDTYNIDYDRSGDIDSGDKRRRPASVTVVVPAAWSGQAAFESILNGYMASAPGAFNAVNL